MQLQLAPGMRVVIRDEEWLVRRADPAKDGGYLLSCDGISELVRGQESLFLTELEDAIEVLDPANTQLVADTSDKYSAALLYIESQRRRSIPNDEQIHVGHQGVMNLVPYQLDPAIQALKQPRSRILIADAVGLGKTLEAAILTSELIQRGRGKRILVVTQKSMLTQFQKEWWSRFSIPLTRLDSVGLGRVRNRIPANHNPFNYFDRSIISMDTLKNNLEYRNYLGNAWWDIIVIDECHNVAARASEQSMSRRARLARLLATRSDTMILLSATPHDGSARSFASLINLLDPTAISDPDEYTADDFKHKGLVVRRFKKDIKDQVTADFQERITTNLRQAASPQEEAAYRALLEVPFTQGGKYTPGKPQELQRVGMQKGMFSSPFAALESTKRRIKLLSERGSATDDEQTEVAHLKDLQAALEAIDASSFSKYQKLLNHLKDSANGWSPNNADDRLVIFSERIETLKWLNTQLAQDLKLKPNQMAVMDGSMSDTDQQEIVERFGRLEDPIRVLLCSDVASEGLNLHYFCHRLVHFDMPWSLMVFQQRNGRVDRYGQKHQPQIVYLTTTTNVEKVKGDLRILEILQTKDEQANLNLGDPAAFLNVYDPDKESEKIADLMASGTAPEVVEAQLDKAAASDDDNEGDWLLNLFAEEPAAEEKAAAQNSLDQIREPISLFAQDYQFAKTALNLLNKDQRLAQWTGDDEGKTIRLTAPRDLQERLKNLPVEVQDKDDSYLLTSDREHLAKAIEQARQAKTEAESWPQLHYLWRQHPIMDWLVDRVLAHFGRHTAPVIESAFLDKGEQAFVMMALIPNRKGQALLVDWQVVSFTASGDSSLQTFEQFAERAKLKADALPNSGKELEVTKLQAKLPQAVALMQQHMVSQQQTFAAQLNERLAGTLEELKKLQEKQMQQLELHLENLVAGVKQSRREQRSKHIHQVFDDYRQWVEDTMTTEPQPYIRVLAAVCNGVN
ncbi:ATP-dependent helicase [Cellvibrio sp. KY-GH-1]|uniref:DEAD/DEAH box helicase n=1 Tax=Cellvibrio sp. KY-GH-1 TaxID=2303332 RepID=UPI001243B6F5|nr:DEAD/DEAH box helicase [Cellvibrio sp. KY-GH-1]QEY16718.1 ATP-dependent helicase [Cellvibrio sp. KY-GH-1]